eukprot:129839_1
MATGQTESKYNDEEEDVVVDAEMAQLAKFTKLIAPIFLVFGVFSLGFMIMSIVKVDKADGWITFMILVVSTIVFSIIAALGVYKWGTVEEQIEMFKEENSKYENEIDELRGTKKQLGGEVTKLRETTNSMNRDVDNLKVTLSQYDELKESLQSVVGDNEKLNDLINDVNDMYDGMKRTILSNKRAGILSAYYDAALKDDDKGMNRREYKRFLARIDKETREDFESFGTFDEVSGADDTIDLGEFQSMVDKLLATHADELMEEQADKVED